MAMLFAAIVGGIAAVRAIDESLKASTDSDIQRHADRLRKKMDGRSFAVVIEKPFVVVTDLPASEVDRWSETIRWATSRLQKQYFDQPPKQIIDVWLFRNSDSYQSHVEELFGRKPTTKFGYYSSQEHALVMDISTGGGTLVHEIVHPFIESNFPECPAWFNEGLASLYEQSQEHRGEIHGLPNWRLKGLQNAIRGGTTVRFRELCHTSSDDFYGDRSGLNYAQARYLCYYLQEKKLLSKFYREFKRSVATDNSGYSTLIQIMDEPDMDEFQHKWEAFVLEVSG